MVDSIREAGFSSSVVASVACNVSVHVVFRIETSGAKLLKEYSFLFCVF